MNERYDFLCITFTDHSDRTQSSMRERCNIKHLQQFSTIPLHERVLEEPGPAPSTPSANVLRGLSTGWPWQGAVTFAQPFVLCDRRQKVISDRGRSFLFLLEFPHLQIRGRPRRLLYH